MDRRPLGGGAYALVSRALERLGVLAAFSERTGGSSLGPFRELNVSFSVGDDPAAVRANRRRLAEALGTAAFAVAGLVHGPRVVRVGPGRAGAGFLEPRGAIAGADGLAASTPGVALAVTCADCVPLVLASSREPTVVVVHAGWRGLAAGVLDRALAHFDDPAGVHAAVGPSVGPCHYEVGEDVAAAVGRALPRGAVTVRRAGRLALDLAGSVRRTLRAAGARRVEVADVCTACEEGRFFSRRRDGCTGRQAAVALRPAG